MGEKKFTPGPWQTDPECGHESVLGPNGAMVADCAIFGLSKQFRARGGDNVANAHLIAAAPDLYEALAALVSSITAITGDGGRRSWSVNAARLAEAYDASIPALSKARGE